MRAIIIPNGSEKPFYKVLINWHSGIDATQLKDLTWCIAESDYLRLPKTITKEVEVTKDNFVTYDVKTELSKLPVKTLLPTDFKVAEPIEIVPKEIIIKK